MCFAESPNHLHVHVVAKPADLPHGFRGAHVFGLMVTEEAGAVPRAEIAALCEHLRRTWAADPSSSP